MSVIDTIARPYAKAIFEIAIQKNNITEWKNILIFINQIASIKKVKSFLSGALSSKDLSLIFIKISHDIINEDAKNLIQLLAENQRLNILNNILKQFLKLETDYQNILIVTLSTAFALQEKNIIEIQKILENVFLKKIKLLLKINPEIIGGIIVYIDDTVFDFSIKNSLKQLSEKLNF
ncbi:F0F1 ATP synthase subunit delta [Buchnera aphidicola]|uniref:ATP synthase subunit delta n=1 Tax=Buchnera aphidicola subsp. Uroleucon sonchi TaxID=118118 RepID=A0A6C1F9S3_BUCUN|nr:F0F1 ATP synthase subunit delta [Buchnera aphidicola]QIE01774.1 F0F1 ATP synthase subunit delta [Buchnera aphidicola (Uroleucon sonchi)]